MGKKQKKEKVKGPNRQKVSKGDNYVVTGSVEIVDVDGDGVSDVVVKHNVTKNEAKLVTGEIVWYGLEDEVVNAFVDIFVEQGLDETIETNKFAQVTKAWKKITNSLKKINKLADTKTVELEEEVEPEEE